MGNWTDDILGKLTRHVRVFSFDPRTGVNTQAKIDSIIEGIRTIDSLHAKTHEGVVYESSLFANNVAAAASLELLFQINAKYPIHARLAFGSEGPSMARLFEGPTFSAAGTAVPAVNRNRRAYAPAAHTVVTHTPTLTGDGTELSHAPVFSATGPGHTLSGGVQSGFEEWLLKEGTVYLFRVTNTHASSALDLWAQVVFYEQTLAL